LSPSYEKVRQIILYGKDSIAEVKQFFMIITAVMNSQFVADDFWWLHKGELS